MPAVATQLRGEDAEMGRFAGAGRAEHQGMADIPHMEIEPEGRRSMGDALHQRRGVRRIQGQGAVVLPVQIVLVGKRSARFHGVQGRAADVLDPMARQAAQEGVHRMKVSIRAAKPN